MLQTKVVSVLFWDPPGRVTFSSVLFNLRLWKREVTDASQYYLKLLKNWREQIRISSSYLEIEFIKLKFKSLWNYKWIILGHRLNNNLLLLSLCLRTIFSFNQQSTIKKYCEWADIINRYKNPSLRLWGYGQTRFVRDGGSEWGCLIDWFVY